MKYLKIVFDVTETEVEVDDEFAYQKLVDLIRRVDRYVTFIDLDEIIPGSKTLIDPRRIVYCCISEHTSKIHRLTEERID